MRLQRLSSSLLLLFVESSPIFAGAAIDYFHDSQCKDRIGTWDSIESIGCNHIDPPFPGSFSSSRVDPGCAVVFYDDDDCSSNATRVPSDDSCVIDAGFLTFSRPCGSALPPLNATSTFHPSWSTTSLDPTSTTHSTQSTASPETVATSATLSLQASSSSQSVPSRTPSEGSKNDGGLSTAGTIAIGVVLPAVSVIVAIIFGIRTWNNGFLLRRAKDFEFIHLYNRRAGLAKDGGDGGVTPSQESIQANEERSTPLT